MEAAVEGVPGDQADQADQADVRAVGDVPLAQHLTAQQILSDDGQAAAVGGADPGGGARLPGAARSAYHHQYGVGATRSGPHGGGLLRAVVHTAVLTHDRGSDSAGPVVHT